MIRAALLWLALFGGQLISARAREPGVDAHQPTPALPNPFGVFNLAPFNARPAQEQVDLAIANGYDGLMASVTMSNPLVRLREFTTVPTVCDGKFRIYSVLWQNQIAKPLDDSFLEEFLVISKKLNAAIWCNIVGVPGERANTIARLQIIADRCKAAGVTLVLYPHYECTFETAEQALEVLNKMNRPEVKISIHLCHELKAGNKDRFDEIAATVAPYLALVSLNGVDTSVDFNVKGWDSMIIPLDKGDFDNRPYLAALVRHGYSGPIFLHNYGFKTTPEIYLPGSIRRWREISADVAKQIAAEQAGSGNAPAFAR
jgi:hypothetical protein